MCSVSDMSPTLATLQFTVAPARRCCRLRRGNCSSPDRAPDVTRRRVGLRISVRMATAIGGLGANSGASSAPPPGTISPTRQCARGVNTHHAEHRIERRMSNHRQEETLA